VSTNKTRGKPAVPWIGESSGKPATRRPTRARARAARSPHLRRTRTAASCWRCVRAYSRGHVHVVGGAVCVRSASQPAMPPSMATGIWTVDKASVGGNLRQPPCRRNPAPIWLGAPASRNHRWVALLLSCRRR
jgi:hypothetical protein